MSAEAEDKKFVVSKKIIYLYWLIGIGIVRHIQERDAESKPRIQEGSLEA